MIFQLGNFARNVLIITCEQGGLVINVHMKSAVVINVSFCKNGEIGTISERKLIRRKRNDRVCFLIINLVAVPCQGSPPKKIGPHGSMHSYNNIVNNKGGLGGFHLLKISQCHHIYTATSPPQKIIQFGAHLVKILSFLKRSDIQTCMWFRFPTVSDLGVVRFRSRISYQTDLIRIPTVSDLGSRQIAHFRLSEASFHYWSH